ncbi:porin [uncultured Massilia sp.]|uniref:porin n=1 Tax=uncultured Massilia sp. TaxID=169973 RepID=UPI0025E4354A|nr:porin [uncultured Massilia sp.]
MNKILLAACACLLPAAAPAQTSVQLYGIADAGLMWQRGSPPKVISGGAEGSRLGIKGSEELGRGMKAIFNLEARVELDTGLQVPTLVNENQGAYLTRGMDALPAPILAAVRAALQPPGGPAVNPERALFDRTAMVGLVTPLGAVLLGRMYTPGYEVFAAADAFEVGTGGTWGSITGGTAGFTALGADIRSQRALQYRVALPSGLGGALMIAGKGSGYLGLYDKFWSAALTYKTAGWDVGIGHNHAYDPDGRPSLRTTTVGGSYVLGAWKVFAGWHGQRNRHSALLPSYVAGWDSLIAPRVAPLGAATAAFLRGVFVDNIAINSQQDATSVQAGLQYRRGAGRIVASLAHQDDHTASDSDATLFALGYYHDLSRRTGLYAVASFIRNDNEAQYSPATAGAPGGFTRAPGEDGRAFQLGVRHRF